MRALGYSIDRFDPDQPGRLCRGRERWVDALPSPEPVPLSRLVVTGCTFSDETARDALRGIVHSGTSPGRVAMALVGDAPLLAVCEGGPPGRVPEGVTLREDLTTTRPFGPLRQWEVRWTLPCRGAEEVDRAIDAGATVFLVTNDIDAPVSEELLSAVYLLAGHALPGPPDRRFQAAALPVVLEHAQACLLVHLDKHGVALGLYTDVEIDGPGGLGGVAESASALLVPFAIPPMLARWDRALWELRQDWDEGAQGPFPVPAAPDGDHTWGRARVQGEE